MAASLQIGLVRSVEGGEVRIRTIKPEFFKHDKLGELPAIARLLFISLWCLADRRGRIEDRPKRIKVECLPYEDCDIDSLLQVLHNAGFICRYEAESVRVIEIEAFEKHQRITGKEADTESELPGKQQGNNGEAPGTGPVAQERKGKERKGIEERKVFDPSAFDASIPPILAESATFVETWHNWVSSRHERKKPISERAAGQQLKSLEGFGSHANAIESLRQSIANDWQGLFPPRETQIGCYPRLAQSPSMTFDTSDMTPELLEAAKKF